MNNLIQISKDKQAVTTSIRVAEVFGKQHCNVLKAVNRLIGEMRIQGDFNHTQNGVVNGVKSDVVKFAVGSYKDPKGESRKQYIMNRDGFTLLAMGFTGPKALKFKLQYIQAFNEMEAKLRAQDVQKKVEALMSARRVDSRVKPENDVKTVGWEVSDADLIRVLHNWHATKNKKETEEFRRLHAENDELRGRLNRISQALE